MFGTNDIKFCEFNLSLGVGNTKLLYLHIYMLSYAQFVRATKLVTYKQFFAVYYLVTILLHPCHKVVIACHNFVIDPV